MIIKLAILLIATLCRFVDDNPIDLFVMLDEAFALCIIISQGVGLRLDRLMHPYGDDLLGINANTGSFCLG